MKKLLVAACAAFACTAFADNQLSNIIPFPVDNVYVNGNVGIASSENLPNASYAGTVNLGYNFNNYVAAEAGYASLVGNDYNTTQVSNIFDLAIKGTMPLSSSGVSLYGRLGAAVNEFGFTGISGNDTPASYCEEGASFMILAGAGFSYELTKSLDARLEDSMYIPTNSSPVGLTNLFLAGLQYNF